MKPYAFILLLSIGLTLSLSGQEVLIKENIQSWQECISFGYYTQAVRVGNEGSGTVKLFNCSVAPGCPEEGTGSKGCLIMRAFSGTIELPVLPSVSEISFQLSAISKGKSVTLQKKIGNTWVDVVTFANIGSPARAVSFKVNAPTSTALRLTSSNSNIYVYDIEVTGNKQDITPALASSCTTVSASPTAVQTSK